MTEIEFKQFLSDVMTASGLIAHGKQSKVLSERLSSRVMELYNESSRLEKARATSEYWKAEHLAGNDEIERLRAALTDTLDFVERHSNRWDGVNGKHPMTVVTAARNLLLPNAEYTAPKPEERRWISENRFCMRCATIRSTTRTR